MLKSQRWEMILVLFVLGLAPAPLIIWLMVEYFEKASSWLDLIVRTVVFLVASVGLYIPAMLFAGKVFPQGGR